MSCKDIKVTGCPTDTTGYCEKVERVVDVLWCSRCTGNGPEMRAKLKAAREKINTRISTPEVIDEHTEAMIKAITVCGICGKWRAKENEEKAECDCRPCAIKNGTFNKCPDDKWAIDRIGA